MEAVPGAETGQNADMNQVDLVAPDIARWRNGNTGIAYVHSFEAARGARPVLTPYDDCILVMPSQRLERGQTAVRFGRWADH